MQLLLFQFVLLFVLGTNCGLRISDILRLNVGDVRNRTHIQITEQKTGKFKKFSINAKLKPMLDDFIKGRRNREPLLLSVWNHRLDRTTSYDILNLDKDGKCSYVDCKCHKKKK